jgi:hypothetical protein
VRGADRAAQVFVLLAAALPAFGQEDDTPNQLWLSYQHQHKVGKHTRVFSSLGYEELLSPGEFIGEWVRLYVKGGGSYDLGSRFRIAAGLG